jgi:hypothetical protein
MLVIFLFIAAILYLQNRVCAERLDVVSSHFETSETGKECVQSEPDSLSVGKVLHAISEDKSWILFNTIATSSDPTVNGQVLGDGGQIYISHLNLTRRQYYRRIDRLRSLGLINRKKGRYSLSSLGRVVYETQKTIGLAIQNRWKLQAIDLLENSLPTNRMPIDGRQKVINTLLGDCETIRNILISHHHHVE